ncbi:putative DNA-directed DNA polymerase [Bradyrhizobium sp. STM 3843]|nr:putative DNA-directed DNA polymerase [Bradyrhizobium sp. STM 3843]
MSLQAADLGAALAHATAAMAAGKRMVRLAARESAVVVIGSDATMSTSIEVPATVEAAGEVVLDAARIAGIASHASGTMTLSAADTSVGITTGQGRYRLPVLVNPPAELVLDDEEASIVIAAQDLRYLLEPVACAGREASRFYLNGILLLSEGGRLTSTATDGVRLLRTSIVAPEFSTDRRLIIPSKSVVAIERLIRRESGMLTLRRNSRLFSVGGAGFTAITRLLDFTYPDPARVLPEASSDAAIIKRQDLVDSLARLMAVMDGEAPLLVIEWHAPDEIFLYLARQPDAGSDLVEAETMGDGLIVVAPQALAALLAEFSSAQLRIEVTNRLVVRSEDKLGVVASMKWDFTPRTAPGATVRATRKGAGKTRNRNYENV